MKGRSRSIRIEGRDFEIREMTAGEILDWEHELERQIREGNVSATDQILIEAFSLTDLAQMSRMTLDQVRDLPPSVLDQLADACKEVNSHFFRQREMLVAPLKSALAMARWASSSAPSSATATRKRSATRGLFSWLPWTK
jgi:hypothetical protein